MAIRFIELQKACDTIPREMTMTTMRWLGFPEVRMVVGTYEDMKSRVLSGPGLSGEFKVNVGLTQGTP